ncbi:hypothetical protein Pcinc_032335, partial [Petrolisthes cinctipes]
MGMEVKVRWQYRWRTTFTPEQAQMDHFLAKVDIVRGDLEKMEVKVSEVQKLHGQILSTSTTEE